MLGCVAFVAGTVAVTLWAVAAKEREDWAHAQAAHHLRAYRAFLTRHPRSEHVADATEAVRALLAERAAGWRDLRAAALTVSVDGDAPGADAARSFIESSVRWLLSYQDVELVGGPADMRIEVAVRIDASGAQFGEVVRLGDPAFGRTTFRYDGCRVAGRIAVDNRAGVVETVDFQGERRPVSGFITFTEAERGAAGSQPPVREAMANFDDADCFLKQLCRLLTSILGESGLRAAVASRRGSPIRPATWEEHRAAVAAAAMKR